VGESQGCLYSEVAAELVKKVVEHSGWRAEELGEGVVRLMGRRRKRGGGVREFSGVEMRCCKTH